MYSVAEVLFSGEKHWVVFTSSFLRSWKGDIVLCVLNKRHDPVVHDTHSKSIIEWLIVFTFLPLSFPRLPMIRMPRKKLFEMTSLRFVAHYQTGPNLHPSSLSSTPVRKINPFIMKQKNEKRGTKASQPAHLNTNLMHLLSRSSALRSAGCSLIVKSFKVYQRKRISDSLPSLHGLRRVFLVSCSLITQLFLQMINRAGKT